MTLLEKEQKEDLAWAKSVLDGADCQCDDPHVARNMLMLLIEHGSTPQLREEAGCYLADLEPLAA